MNGTPVICFAGYSGSGKTTLLEQLLPELADRGLRVAVVKHDTHGLTLGRKDSHRLFAAGAACSVVNSPEATEILLRQAPTLEETLSRLPEVDLILIEGYKHCAYTRFGICRAANGKGFPDDTGRFTALITDTAPENPANRPVFGFSETGALADFILSHMDTFTHYAPTPSADA